MGIGVFSTVFSLALLAGLVIAIVSVVRRGPGGGIDARSVRRFFQYVLLFALVMVVAIGLATLLARLLGGEVEEWEDPRQLLAEGLAYVLTGLPIAGLLGWWTWQSHRRDPEEGDSPLFVAYVTLAAVVSAAVAATAVQGLVYAAIDEGRFDVEAAAGLVAWGAVWALHWVIARRALDTERGAPHLLLGSLVGLVLAVTGLVITLGSSLDLLLRPDVVGRPLAGVAEGAGLLVAGALLWVRYWATAGIALPRRQLWLAYVLPIGVGGGLVLALVAASRLLWSVLVWLVGDRLGATASQHFDSATTEVAALAVGLLVWWYHRTVLASGGDEEARSEWRRVYEYLVAGIALVAAAFGVGTVLVAFIEAVTPGIDVGMTVLNTLLAALTLLAVGVPVWWLFWRRIRRAAADSPHGELGSPTRRVYLVLLFGVAGVAAVIALITVAVTFFTDVVAGQLGATTLRSMRYGLGTLVATAAVSAYHGSIFRADRATGIRGRADGPRSVVLVGPVTADLDRAVTRATGARVTVWGRLDAVGAPFDLDELTALLAAHPGQDVLVVAEPTGPRLVVVDPTGRRWATPPEEPVEQPAAASASGPSASAGEEDGR